MEGVTTNHSLMVKEGVTRKIIILDHYKKICAIVTGNVSAEVITTKFDKIIKEGVQLCKAWRRCHDWSTIINRWTSETSIHR